MKALMLEMQYPPREEVNGIAKYTWHRLPNNWLVIQEVVAEDDLEFWSSDLSFPVYGEAPKNIQLRTPKTIIKYMFHVIKEDAFCFLAELPEYYQMASGPDLSITLQRARNAWARHATVDINVELEKISNETRENKEGALDQIEGVVSSVIKRDASKLTKADFSYIFVGIDGRWKSFYPTIKQLLDFHTMNNKTVNEDYVAFLKSDECASMREVFESEKGVTVREKS